MTPGQLAALYMAGPSRFTTYLHEHPADVQMLPIGVRAALLDYVHAANRLVQTVNAHIDPEQE